MVAAALYPDIHLRIGINIAPPKRQNRGFVVVGLKDAVQQSTEFHRSYLHGYADVLQVLLDDSGHLRPLSVGRTAESGEFHRRAAGRKQSAVRPPGETSL